ncbi:RHS repeat-associated core domain-containing protein [Massilia sp. CCM 9210]|uniref:RHS repeat-associated core domain-containing protein n=1 Tax=Massilia scottii TaxID=3057166 RepID=UPI002796CF23|nr:RHS repeat-associated core domain-containing protein [Massilia sp. CCM 9210]MDQ1815672.1 RHS repeat-associated core domain-containing protein [Massilia sp. CCM 9210]
MPTNVRTDNNDLVSQHSKGVAAQPADPVFLKPKGDPGIAPHFNISTKINNPAGTVYDHKTRLAHSESYMGQGKHVPIVIVGRNTAQVDGDNGFLSWMKNVYIEKRNAVMHGVKTGVNSLWSMLPPALKTAIQNGGQIASGMTLKDFGDAAKDDAQAMLDALMSKDTVMALAQTAALMAVSAVPVVGQLAGGAAAVQRIKGAISAVDGAADELKAMVDRWSKPMSPAQIAAERKKLASFLIRVGVSALLAALGKASAKLSARSKGKENSTQPVVVGQADLPKGTCKLCVRGKPVIIATGEKSLSQVDFSLPGTLQIEWNRTYRSGDASSAWFGQGWSTPLGVTLHLAANGIAYHDAGGRAVRLPSVECGAELFDAYEQLTVRRPSVHVWEIVFKDGQTLQFRREREDFFILPLTSIVDRNGNTISLQYPAPNDDPFEAQRPQLITDSAGRRLHLAWNAASMLTSVTLLPVENEEVHVLAHYAYSAEGDLISHTDAQNGCREYEWHNHILVAYTEPDGARYCAEYDEYSTFGRVVRSYAAVDGRGLTFEYLDRARITRITDGIGRTTIYEYDERKEIIATTGPDGVRVETPTDANGNQRGAADALGRQSHYRYDGRGNLIDFVDATGARTSIEYNQLDLPVKLTDPLQHDWRRQYDIRGNIVAVIDPLERVAQYNNDSCGLPTAITDARGGSTALEWTRAGELASFTDCSGHVTTFEYDRLGRLVCRRDALGQVTRYQWDQVGRLVKLTDAAGGVQEYSWTAEGRLLSHTDACGARTTYRYNAHTELIQRTDANGHHLTYGYDAIGRLTSLTNENGESTAFIYDLSDRLSDEIGFDGRHQRYCYNCLGELTHLVEAGGTDAGPGKVTFFDRDALGRVVAKLPQGEPDCHAYFSFDAVGRLIAADNAAARIAFAYDASGQLTGECQTLAGGAPRELAHSYDMIGNRTRTVLPDERALDWLYYGSGHLHQIGLEETGQRQVIADIERDALHRETARSQGALESAYQYDPMGRLSRHRVVSGKGNGNGLEGSTGVAIERTYRYDPSGKLITKTDSLRNQMHYRYDPVGRILAATGERQESFAFDPAGNIQQPATVGIVRGNRLGVYQDLRYTYDSYGNVSTRAKGAHERAEFGWNALHQLQRATVVRHGVTQTTGFEYDALGRRTRKSDTFGVTEFLWDGDLLLESRRGSKNELFVFEPDSFAPLATIQNQKIYWYQNDQAGTPQELTDANGRIAWSADYKVWGEARLQTLGEHARASASLAGSINEHPVSQPFRFQGQQFDEETGLHYNRFRYYDPAVGRFVSLDPIGLDGGFNLFSYAPNPLRYIDPFGLAGTTLDATGASIPTNNHGIPDKNLFTPKKGIAKYKRVRQCGPVAAQDAAVQGLPCVVCGTIAPRMVADHIDGLAVEHYRTGTNDIAHQTSIAAVQPHCPRCSSQQGGMASAFSKCMHTKI